MNRSKSSPKMIDGPLSNRDLHQVALEALDWGDGARITRIWELKNHWIPYPQANAIIRKAEQLLGRPKAPRMKCMLAYGEPDSGKTMLQKHYCDRHPINMNPNGDAVLAEVIGVEIRGSDIGAFHDAILMKLKAPFRIQDSAAKKRHQVMNILTRVGTRQILIDELNTAIAGHTGKQKAFLAELKNLLNELKLTVFATGTDDARVALAVDKQLNSRFKDKERLRCWGNDDDFRRLLHAFERRLPLRERSQLHAPSLASTIHNLTEGYMGEVAELLMSAAVVAIETGKERIDRKLLLEMHWSNPSQNRLDAHVAGSSKAA